MIVCATARLELRQAGQTAGSPAWATKDLRAGIIGTDTSHVPQFTAMFNKTRPEWRIKVVAAFKGGSSDLPTSANRLEGFAKTIREEYGVEIVDSIEVLLSKVDVVLLESVDGPFFSSSSYRFYPDVVRLRSTPGVGKVLSVQASSPFNTLEFHPDLFYYGIHGIEALYAVMGTGCVSVTRRIEGGGDVTTCTWEDGRVGSYFGPLPDPAGSKSAVSTAGHPPVVRITGDKGTAEAVGQGYDGLELAIAEFLQTGRPPFDVAETIEIFEFMTAAQISKERGGAPVTLASLRK